jgi:putative ABC transport system substrate-binding protein
LAREHKLPAIYPYRDFVEVGGLLAYGPDLGDMASQLAAITAQVLRGARAEDLPIQQATKFAFAVNLRTAKALGLTIPPTLLARADEVIE